MKFLLLTILIWTTFIIHIREVLSHTDINVGYPAMTMDYKIHVDAGKEECVYQYTTTGAVLYVDFQVIRGGDGKASFMVKNPDGDVVLPYEWQEKATYEVEKAQEGAYMICIDNQHSKFSAKLVSVYMATYESAGWDQFMADIQQIDVDTEIFSRTFTTVSQRITEVLQYLHQSKSQEARDYALLSENNYKVGFWSFVQCVIILGSGSLHVYSIRQLFTQVPSHGKYNVRP